MKTHLMLLLGWLCTLSISISAAEINPPNGKDVAADLAQQADAKLQANPTKKDYQDAADLLAKAASLDPNNMDIALKLGWVYLDKLHDPHAAYSHLRAVVNQRPNDVDARKLLGLACGQTGRLREALAEFQRASQLQPDDLWIRANVGRSFARLGEYAKADAIYEDILKKDPTQPDARLGQAELAAWRGHSSKALEILDKLIAENPANVEALTLRGDVHRWNWQLGEAQHDYHEALQAEEDAYEAKTGMVQAKQMASSDVTLKGYQFEDTTHFKRESAELDPRVYLSDRAYLLGKAAGWRFTNPGFESVDRIDGGVGVEYHWARFLETSLEGDVFDYQHQDSFFGGQLSTKLSPATGFDIYTILAYNQPFISSMAAVTNGLKQESIGNGLDISIGGGFSVQNSLTLARISDHNTWWEEKPQLSYRLFGRPLTFIRVEYDYLHYSDANTNYWTPSHWHLLAPVLDTSLPLGKAVHINVDAKAPYVFDASKFGFEVEGGPIVDLGSQLQLGGSYIYSSLPADPETSVDRPPWSGHGWQAFLRFRF